MSASSGSLPPSPRASNLLEGEERRAVGGAAGESELAALHVASVTRTFPAPWNPTQGAFVERRLAAMAELASVRLVQPIPWCPVVRPLPHDWRAPGRLPRLPIERVPMFYLPGMLKSWDGHWLARSIAPTLTRLRREGVLSLIDAHFGYPDGAGAIVVGRRLGVPVFITMRGLEAVAVQRPRIRDQLSQALRAATGVIAVSQNLAQLALAQGVSPERVRVIPNAVDDSVFHPGDRREARQRLGLPLDRPLVVSVGLLLEAKGHHEALTAISQVRARYPEVSFAILGAPAHEPRYPEQLSDQIAALGLKNAARLVGAVEPNAVADWLRAADLFTLATHREGCCNAVLEALACGIPVVSTPVGDNPRFVRDEIEGYLVPVGDTGALAEALSRALARSWDAEQVAARVPRGWSTVAADVLRFFVERSRVDGIGAEGRTTT